MGVQIEDLRQWRIVNLTGISNQDVRKYFNRIAAVRELIELERCLTSVNVRGPSRTNGRGTSSWIAGFGVNDVWSGRDCSRFVSEWRERLRKSGRREIAILCHKSGFHGVIGQGLRPTKYENKSNSPLFLYARTPETLRGASVVEKVFSPEDRPVSTISKYNVLYSWLGGPGCGTPLTVKEWPEGPHYESYRRRNKVLEFLKDALPTVPLVNEKRRRRGSKYTFDACTLSMAVKNTAYAYLSNLRAGYSIQGILSRQQRRDAYTTERGARKVSPMSAPFCLGVERAVEAVKEAENIMFKSLSDMFEDFVSGVPEEFIMEPEQQE